MAAMTRGLVEAILADYAHSDGATDDPSLEAVRVAIFLEDTFGITLTDPEIDRAVLGTPTALRSLVTRHLGIQ